MGAGVRGIGPVSVIASALALIGAIALDGDTLRAGGETYRLAGIDAPEVGRAACDIERARGLAARERVRALLAEARVIEARPASDPPGRRVWPRDRYGRRLATIAIDGVDLGAALIADGLAAPWSGRGARPDWGC